MLVAKGKITLDYLKGISTEKKFFPVSPIYTQYTRTSARNSITIIINYCNLCTAKNKTKCLMFRIQTINMCESEWKIFSCSSPCVSSLNIEPKYNLAIRQMRKTLFCLIYKSLGVRMCVYTRALTRHLNYELTTHPLVISYQNIIIVSQFSLTLFFYSDYFYKSFV